MTDAMTLAEKETAEAMVEKEQAETMAARYAGGMSLHPLAVEYHLTPRQVRAVLVSVGCPIRGRGRRKKK